MKFASPDENFQKAESLIRKAAAERPDVIVLPETWNTGFFPHDDLPHYCDADGARTKRLMSALAAELGVNIVAGSVSALRDGLVRNTSYVFTKAGECVGSYDKTHLFTPMHEDAFYEKGQTLCRFSLDGLQCAVLICYDIRFPELTRTLSVQGLDVLFLPSQWPAVRSEHLLTLCKARAIENQMFVVNCNSCGTAGETVYGGASSVWDPWGNSLAQAGTGEELLPAELDPAVLQGIRESINVFRDRRPELYNL
jgi:predicted amidohydrolase